MGFFKKVWSGVKDVAQAVAYVVAAPVNSITGNEYTPDYETKFGNLVGQTLENSVDNVHTLAKSFADTLLGGLPSRIANKFRDADDQESRGNYLENSKDYGFDLLNGLNDISGVLGSSFANSVGGIGGGGEQAPQQQRNFIAENSILISVIAVMLGCWLVIKLIFK